jgi:hypothetical protein
MIVCDPVLGEFLPNLRAQLLARMATLEPAVHEYEELTAAIEGRNPPLRVSSVPGEPVPATPPTPRRARSGSAEPAPMSSTPVCDGHARPSPRGDPNQRPVRDATPGLVQAVLDLVLVEPGLTVPELAGRLNSLQNPLYRIVGTYEREGKLVKQGRGWHATPAALGQMSQTSWKRLTGRAHAASVQAA